MTTTTETITTAHSLTANTQFKANYHRYLRNALIWAVVLHIAAFVLSPEFTFKPYKLKDETFEVVELPANIEIPPPPKEIALPQVPVEAAEGDDDTEDEMAPTTFDSFEDMPPPPPPSSGGGDVFLAFDEPPELLYFEMPAYPPLAREAGIEGTVAIRVLVNEHGKVVSADVLNSDVTPAMEKAALAAARKCKFRPAKQRTIAVKAHVMIPFQFQLTSH
ncbi:MAG: energy transducer TonB [Candidatus Krumholzibacteria bacterium]|nr:energy transducer TonB [Candidatus Krumholzibacteria bacterium]